LADVELQLVAATQLMRSPEVPERVFIALREIGVSTQHEQLMCAFVERDIFQPARARTGAARADDWYLLG
jgi:hypothetical protein